MLRTLRITVAPASRAPNAVCHSALMSLQWTTRQPVSRTKRNVWRFVRSADPACTPSSLNFQAWTSHPASRQRCVAGVSRWVTTIGLTRRRFSSTWVILSTPPLARLPLCDTTKMTGSAASAADASTNAVAAPRGCFIFWVTVADIGWLPFRFESYHHIAGGHVRVAVRRGPPAIASIRSRQHLPDAPPDQLWRLPMQTLFLQQPVMEVGRQSRRIGGGFLHAFNFPLLQEMAQAKACKAIVICRRVVN